MAGEDNNAGSGSPVVKKQKKLIDIRQLFAEWMGLKSKELDIRQQELELQRIEMEQQKDKEDTEDRKMLINILNSLTNWSLNLSAFTGNLSSKKE